MRTRIAGGIPGLAAAMLLAAGADVCAQATPPPAPGANESGRSGLAIEVMDADSARRIPCRITVVDERGVLAPLSADPPSKLAVRPGVVYTPDGRADIQLSPGRYTVYASRGFEFGVEK